MSRDYGSLLGDWYITLIEVATVFGTCQEHLRQSLAKRADSIRGLEKEFRERVELPRLQPADRCIGRIKPYGATQRGADALERLRALRVSASGISSLRGHHTPAEYDFTARLNLRWHKLRDLEKQLAAVNMARYEMEQTVPSTYYLHVLGEMKDIRPCIKSEQAVAIFTLHRAGVPAEYVAGVTSPAHLNPETAKAILGLYADGTPAEYAKEIL